MIGVGREVEVTCSKPGLLSLWCREESLDDDSDTTQLLVYAYTYTFHRICSFFALQASKHKRVL